VNTLFVLSPAFQEVWHKSKNKGWIFPRGRLSLLNSFSHLVETVFFRPVREVAESNLEGMLVKNVGAQ